jgi:hypothetical protein
VSDLLPRITEVLQWSGLGPAAFADEIGVARAVMSHILSARNKASLEVIQKVLFRFQEISPAWLLLEQGAMLKSLAPEGETSGTPILTRKPQGDTVDEEVSNSKMQNKKAPDSGAITAEHSRNRRLLKVMLLYSDGKFESFEP